MATLGFYVQKYARCGNKIAAIFLCFSLLGCNSETSVQSETSNNGGAELFDDTVAVYQTNNYSLDKLRVGDINHDGKNDVIALTRYESFKQQIQVYYQRLSGDFDSVYAITTTDLGGATSDLTGIRYIQSIEIGDIDSDNEDEILVTAYDSSNIGSFCRLLVLEYDELTGNIVEVERLTVGDPYGNGSYVGDMVVTDANGDGLKDIVVVFERHLNIFYQTIAGSLQQYSFSDAISIDDPPDNSRIISHGDLNNDGLRDVIVRSQQLQISVLKQESGLGLIDSSTYPVETEYWSTFDAITIDDISGDSLDDIVVVDPASPYFNFFMQDQFGAIRQQVASVPNGVSPCSISIADFNHDGYPDLLGETTNVENLIPKLHINVYLQSATGEFNTRDYRIEVSSFGACQSSQTLVVGDVTGDSKLDVITTWSKDGIFVFQGI